MTTARLDELLDQYRRIDDEAHAEAFLRRLLHEFPSEPQVLVRWGIARAEADPEEARSFMVRAAELAADDPYTQVRIGRALERLGATDEALACAMRVQARIPPDYADAAPLANLVGKIAASKGMIDDARNALKAAYDAEPDYPDVAYDLALFLLRHDGREAALEVLRQLPDELPDDDPARALLAELERA